MPKMNDVVVVVKVFDTHYRVWVNNKIIPYRDKNVDFPQFIDVRNKLGIDLPLADQRRIRWAFNLIRKDIPKNSGLYKYLYSGLWT